MKLGVVHVHWSLAYYSINYKIVQQQLLASNNEHRRLISKCGLKANIIINHYYWEHRKLIYSKYKEHEAVIIYFKISHKHVNK